VLERNKKGRNCLCHSIVKPEVKLPMLTTIKKFIIKDKTILKLLFLKREFKLLDLKLAIAK
jgi:hypothetical protein